MPIPFILAGLALVTTAIGASCQQDAKETNEKAQKIVDEAQKMYENAGKKLEYAKKQAEISLTELGYTKKKVLTGSVERFIQAYRFIKDAGLVRTIGLNEYSKFAVNDQEILQLCQMSDMLCDSAEAVVGSVIALAAGGSLPVVTGSLSAAGSAILAGHIGAAASFTTTALTPLAAVIAPVVLFNGLTAGVKADENLEKAEAMYAEAQVAVEKMAASEMFCIQVIEWAELFNELLTELDKMLLPCTKLLEQLVSRKMLNSKGKIDVASLTEQEENLIAVTRALVKSVKQVIVTPILDEDGCIYKGVQSAYNDISEKVDEYKNVMIKIM